MQLRQPKFAPTLKPQTDIFGVKYNNTATIKLLPGMTYHSVDLVTNLDDVEITIDHVEVKIGANAPVKVYATQLVSLDRMYKRTINKKILTLPLSNFDARTLSGIVQTQLVTGIKDDVSIKVKFKNKAVADPATLDLRVDTWVTDNDSAGRIWQPKRFDTDIHITSTKNAQWTPSVQDLTNMSIQRMVFDESNMTINAITVHRLIGTENRTIREIQRESLDYHNERYGGVVKQAGSCLLDFTLFGFANMGALSAAGLNFSFDVTSGGALPVYIEGYQQLRPLQPQAPANTAQAARG